MLNVVMFGQFALSLISLAPCAPTRSLVLALKFTTFSFSPNDSIIFLSILISTPPAVNFQYRIVSGMRQKFHMDKYYDDLGNVEEKLNRIKSEKSTKQIKREDSRGHIVPEAGGWVGSRAPIVPTRPYAADKPVRPPSK